MSAYMSQYALGLSKDTGGNQINYLTGTGSASASSNLVASKMATVMNGPQAVRILLSATSATALTSTGFYLAAGGRYDWWVETSTQRVNAIASDGSTAWDLSYGNSS